MSHPIKIDNIHTGVHPAMAKEDTERKNIILNYEFYDLVEYVEAPSTYCILSLL